MTETVAEREKKKEKKEGLREYELIYLVDAGLEKEQIDQTVEKVRGVVESFGGDVENVRISEIRPLAYQIKKRTHGIYVVINFDADGKVIQELDRQLKLDGRVLRHMLMRTDK